MPDPFNIEEIPPNKVPVNGLRPYINQLIQAVKSLKPARSPDFISRTTATGTVLKLQRKIVGGGGAAAGPFTITDASGATGTPTAKAAVAFGSVASIVPTMDGTSLSSAPLHTFSSAGTYNGYIDYSSGVAIITWSTSAVPADSSTHTYALIGQVVVAASGGGYAVTGIAQAVSNSFFVRYCSGSIWFWTALATP